ncbi:glycosyltransferase family protein [Rhizobium rhizogenes]|uniref:glycosyltransferase family protein n=1 Tax=Rhizobium rhizogenes TaxID=359 RepID=UPI0024BE361C|nr:glycosyltransferase [Rhizobium rhizogenes]MDJ1638179.1 glycosyltransferase [Rhizobium rhizogenes]
MKLTLVLCDEAIFSFKKGNVWGEEIDALGIKDEAENTLSYERCRITSPNILCYLKAEGVDVSTDVAIHFSHPSELIDGAINVLYFQQFFEYSKHDLSAYKSIYDFILTPGEEIARQLDFIHYWPLAVSQLQMEVAPSFNKNRSGAVFIGNERMRSKEQYDAALAPFGSDLSVYGSGWDPAKYPYLAQCIRGVCEIEDTSKIYSSALAAISLHRREYSDLYGLATNRSFHAILNGCLVFSDANESLRRLMGDGRGVIFCQEQDFRAVPGIYEKLWLEEQRAIEAGRKHILGNHRWSNRLLELEELVS